MMLLRRAVCLYLMFVSFLQDANQMLQDEKLRAETQHAADMEQLHHQQQQQEQQQLMLVQHLQHLPPNDTRAAFQSSGSHIRSKRDSFSHMPCSHRLLTCCVQSDRRLIFAGGETCAAATAAATAIFAVMTATLALILLSPLLLLWMCRVWSANCAASQMITVLVF